jgi:uncharacterized protein DUF4124
MPSRFLLAVIVLAFPSVGAADICKYEDQEGRITFSNVPIKGAKKMTCFEPLSPVPAAKQKRRNQGPADFPKVDANTQKTRDESRRKILVDELSQENGRLDEARQALDEERRKAKQNVASAPAPEGNARAQGQIVRRDPKGDERIKVLQDDVVLHERNVEALKKELGNLK